MAMNLKEVKQLMQWLEESGMTDFGTMKEYSKIDAGFTDFGFQVWCRRHDHNVCHINFEGNDLSTDLRCIVASSD